MNKGRILFALGAFLTVFFTAFATADAQIYSGRATGVRSAVTVNNNTVNSTVADTCPLSITGGSNIATTPVGFVSGLLRTGTITSTTSGAGTTSQSSSTVQDLNLSAGGYTIRATSVSSNAQCNCCVPSAPTCGGKTTIVGLSVTDPNGNPVAAVPNGSVNQTISLGSAGSIIINEQISTPGAIDVNALHINITGANGTNSNVIIAASHADIDCTTASPTPGEVTVSGRVVDANGRAIAKANLTLRDGSGVVATAVSSSTGNFVLADIEAGDTYILETTKAGYSFPAMALNLSEDVTIEVRADNAATSGQK